MLIFLRVFLMLLMAMVSANVLAAAATVINLSGTLSVQKSDGAVKILSTKSELDAGDMLSTQKDSFARIRFTDGGEVTLRPNSTMKIDEYGFNEEKPEKDSFVFSLVKGGLRTITGLVGKRGNRDAYRLNTANATIGIRGTHYGVLMVNGDFGSLPDGVYLDVITGMINARNNAGDLDFGAGTFGFVGGLNIKPVLLPANPGVPLGDGESFTSGAGGNQTGGAGCYLN